LDFLSDMNDWVKEAKREEPRCITRAFSLVWLSEPQRMMTAQRKVPLEPCVSL
jgi:hypothetical protein